MERQQVFRDKRDEVNQGMNIWLAFPDYIVRPGISTSPLSSPWQGEEVGDRK